MASDMKALRDYQQKLQEDNEAYPEIKVPPEFVSKFEMEKGLAPGDTVGAAREIQDEIRIRYLQR